GARASGGADGDRHPGAGLARLEQFDLARVAGTREVDLRVGLVLLLLRDAVAAGALDSAGVCVVGGADRRRQVPADDRGRAGLRDAGVDDARRAGELPRQRGRALHRGGRRRAGLLQAFFLLVAAGGEAERGEAEEEREGECLRHLVCGIAGKVAERGSSRTGAYVMSLKRAKYTSSSTTPSWFRRLNARSSPFAPSTVTSSRAAVTRRGSVEPARVSAAATRRTKSYAYIAVSGGWTTRPPVRVRTPTPSAPKACWSFCANVSKGAAPTSDVRRPPANVRPSIQAGWSASCCRTNGSAPVGGVYTGTAHPADRAAVRTAAIVAGRPQTRSAVACARRARRTCGERSSALAGSVSSSATELLFPAKARRSSPAPASP